MTTSRRPSLLRRSDRAGAVTNVELFFDLVYVFAVTRLSETLLHGEHPTVNGAVQAAILLAMVWQIWVYTTWAVNYLDPDRPPARTMLLLVMAGSLVLSTALPGAFHDLTWAFAVTYAIVHVGRVAFVVWALRGEQLQIAFWRILPWTVLSCAVVLVGAGLDPHPREVLWALAVAIDLVAASVGFWVPGLGGSDTHEWTISGSHFAERTQAFVLIALGESIVAIGAELNLTEPTARDVVSFVVAFAGAALLWWIYFDRAAEDSARTIGESDDPGRLARSAFHWTHPLIVFGIILVAAGDELGLAEPGRHDQAATAWLVLGGTAVFLAGHALFKWVVWRSVSWSRLAGAAAALVLVAFGGHVSNTVVGVLALAVVLAVAIVDRIVAGPRELLDEQGEPVRVAAP